MLPLELRGKQSQGEITELYSVLQDFFVYHAAFLIGKVLTAKPLFSAGGFIGYS